MREALQEIVDTFASVDVNTRRMLLLDFADHLPALPERYRLAMEHGAGRVHECQSPVFVFPEVSGRTVRLFTYAPPEAPTVRGVVSILAQALDGSSPTEISSIPDDIFARMGLVEALGMMRQQGLAAVLARLKEAVAAQVLAEDEAPAATRSGGG
jgi:cysteine desulfuration protein SufE